MIFRTQLGILQSFFHIWLYFVLSVCTIVRYECCTYCSQINSNSEWKNKLLIKKAKHVCCLFHMLMDKISFVFIFLFLIRNYLMLKWYHAEALIFKHIYKNLILIPQKHATHVVIIICIHTQQNSPSDLSSKRKIE